MDTCLCVICKKEIEYRLDTQGFDPCALTLTTHIDCENGEQKEQEFYCHFDCFRKIVNDDQIFHIKESDYPTKSEIDSDEDFDRLQEPVIQAVNAIERLIAKKKKSESLDLIEFKFKLSEILSDFYEEMVNAHDELIERWEKYGKNT